MSKCTACGSAEAYVGTLFVECPEEGCEFFTLEQQRMAIDARTKERNKKLDEARKKRADERKEATTTTSTSSTGFSWGGVPLDPDGAGTGKIKYKQMKFADLSTTKRSDADITPLATPVNSPPIQGRQGDESPQRQGQPPLDTSEDELDFFAIYYNGED